MRKLAVILSVFLFLLAILAAGTWFAPHVLNITPVKRKLIARVSKQTDADITLQRIDWHWFPTLHIDLIGLELSKKHLDVSIPKLSVYPDLLKLLEGRIGLYKILLTSPTIQAIGIPSAGSEKGGLLARYIEIKDGTLFWKKTDSSSRYFAKHIDLNARIAQGHIKVKLACIPSYARHLALTLSLNTSDMTYSGDAQVTDLRAHRLLMPYIASNPIKPVKAIVNLKAEFSGKGRKYLSASIRGDLPCLLLRHRGKDLRFACGYADLKIKKTPDTLKILINRLQLSSPKLEIAGIFTSSLISTKKFYDINVIAKDVDLAAVRRRLLAVWGADPVMKQVCDIVRSGHASRIDFIFHGPLSEMEDVDNLNILASVDHSNIFVPYGPLDLKDVSGFLKIQNGLLIATNASATLENRKITGTNGVFILGISGRDNPLFHLDINIKADLHELAGVLHRVVPLDTFQKELSLFKNIQGSAQGNLYLGNDLDHMTFRVKLNQVDASANYTRLDKVISITRARLSIDNSKICWNKLSGTVGDQDVLSSDGMVIFGDVPWLKINYLKARIDSSRLLHTVNNYKVLRTTVSKYIERADGPVLLTCSNINGPVLEPAYWAYKINLSAQDLSVKSPLLPDTVDIKDAGLSISPSDIYISHMSCRVDNSIMDISASLHYPGLHGSFNVSGHIGKKFASWIAKQNLIPSDFFPLAPIDVKSMRVVWGKNSLTLKANVSKSIADSKSHKVSRATVQLDIAKSDNSFLINELKINGPDNQQCSMFLSYNRANEKIQLAWDGNLKAALLNKLLLHNTLLTGQMDGSFAVSYDPALNSAFKITGTAEIKGLSWRWGIAKPIEISYLLLTGRNNTAYIEDATVKLAPDQKIQLSGSVKSRGKGFHLHIICSADTLSSETLESFEPSPDSKQGININGDISFFIGKLFYKLASKQINKTIVVRQITGKIELFNSNCVKLILDRAWICKLCVSGCFNMPLKNSAGKASLQCPVPKRVANSVRPTNKESYQARPCQLWIRTIRSDKLQFNTLLSCLGIKQDVISGDINVDIHLHGIPGNWKSGTVHIWSNSGRIYRMAALAKILSIINFTDFLTEGLPKLNQKGFGYSKLEIKGKVKDNKIHLDNAFMSGEGLDFFARGWINIKTWHIKITVLVSPFKTIDLLLRHLPIIGQIIGGKTRTLVTIPVGLSGPFNDPKINILPAKAIGKGFLGLVERTIGFPVIIFNTIKKGL